MSPRTALRRLPACATTGIGSLPHADVARAVEVAVGQTVPFLPELPGESPAALMLPSALERLPGLQVAADGATSVDVDAWRRGRDRLSLELDDALAAGQLQPFEPTCRGWRPFLAALGRRPPVVAKVQLAGPATLRWATRTTDGRSTRDVPELDEQVLRLVAARALAMVHALRLLDVTPMLFLDEPGLVAFSPGDVHHREALAAVQWLVGALQRAGALVGVHCCGNTDWPSVFGLGLDVVSLDARLSLDAALEDRGAWGRFVTSGATLALGLVPTAPAASWSLPELCDAVEASLRATALPGLPFEALLPRLLLTPACGLAFHGEGDAEHVFEQVHEARRRLISAIA